MTKAEANKILTETLSDSRSTFNSESLYSMALYLLAYSDEEKAMIDGEFTADQLEAIAMWMRDPEGVANQ